MKKGIQMCIMSIMLGVASVPCIAAELAPEQYRVSVEILNSGEVIGSPEVVVVEGMPAQVKVDGEHGYSLLIEVTPQVDEHVNITTSLDAAGQSMKPSMVSQIGSQSEVFAGQIGMRITADYINRP